VKNLDPQTLNFKRNIKLTPITDNPPNVVVIVMESMAAHKTGILGHPMDPTPYLDKIAKKAWTFSNFYVPSEGTARSMFGLVSSLPDVSRKSTSSRNPLLVSQNTAINALVGYEKYYFIGGSANWGNIRGVITHNVPGIHVYEEGSFNSPRTDVWGLSDLDLLKEANKVLSKRIDKKPFFALIQMAGFHRPYTIPENRDNFESKKMNEVELKKYGFVSNDEYNSLRFADFSLGKFIESAQGEKYFDNTLFVILGDHGLPDLRAQHVPKGIRHHLLERFHVPLIIYAPKLITEPKIIDTIATEPDVLPTVAGITGHKFEATGFGRNLMAKDDSKKYSLNYVYYRTPPQISIHDDEFYLVGEPDSIRGLYKYTGENPEKDVSADHPERLKEMKKMLFGLYETSLYMLHHNPNQFKQKVSLNKGETKETNN